jgi:hypothetical protein
LARYPSGRIFIVRNEFANVQTELGSIANSRIVTGNATTGTTQRANSPLPPSYREIATRFWPGFPSVRVLVFER